MQGLKANRLKKRSEDFSQWYQDVINQASLADSSCVPGCIVFLPHGFAIWENIQRILDIEFKKTGVQNVYFPLFIPARLLEKEKEHVEGFSPQTAVVTHGGGKKLLSPLIVRPTSETIIWDYYGSRTLSYRELPLVINQWCNVVRWELRTRPFLRTSEFLWQEGHTAHVTAEEAEERARLMLEVYRRFFEDVLALAPITGQKSAQEKFAGAERSYSLEVLAQDGRAIQAGTSHYFGTKFTRKDAFNVRYLNKEGKEVHPFTTSWGVSTRLIGTLIMSHGDDNGLVLPPRIAPIQVSIVSVITSEAAQAEVLKACETIAARLRAIGLSVVEDLRDLRPGNKYYEWELKGVPLRIEVGARDLAQQVVTVARRDNFAKTQLKLSELESGIGAELSAVQDGIRAKAIQARDSKTFQVDDFAEFQRILRESPGFMRAHWCGRANCENEIKELTQATIRNIPFGSAETGKCIKCGQSSSNRVLFAKAY